MCDGYYLDLREVTKLLGKEFHNLHYLPNIFVLYYQG
jgi:hypothetical protein